MKLLLILALLLTGCSSGGGPEPKENSGTFVFGDSVSWSDLEADIKAWPYYLGELSGELVEWDSRPGATLMEYDLKGTVEDQHLAGKYKYGVLALGGHDVLQGMPLIDALYQFEDSLLYLESQGFEPVCITYSYTMVIKDHINPFNNGIKEICNRRGYKIITSTEQMFDGVHPTDTGSLETAEDAWRVLF